MMITPTNIELVYQDEEDIRYILRLSLEEKTLYIDPQEKEDEKWVYLIGEEENIEYEAVLTNALNELGIKIFSTADVYIRNVLSDTTGNDIVLKEERKMQYELDDGEIILLENNKGIYEVLKGLNKLKDKFIEKFK